MNQIKERKTYRRLKEALKENEQLREEAGIFPGSMPSEEKIAKLLDLAKRNVGAARAVIQESEKKDLGVVSFVADLIMMSPEEDFNAYVKFLAEKAEKKTPNKKVSAKKTTKNKRTKKNEK